MATRLRPGTGALPAALFPLPASRLPLPAPRSPLPFPGLARLNAGMRSRFGPWPWGGLLLVALALGLATGCARHRLRPPREPGPFASIDLVAVRAVEPGLRLDVRYATSNNFVGRPVYPVAAVYLQRPAALALARAHARLAPTGHGIVVFDGYRPWSVTRLFWESVPPAQRDYVANPAKGSRHNRGCAVDCSLFDLRTGAVVDMPSAYDEPTARAHADFPGGTAPQRHARDLLRSAMEAEGFRVLSNEWWHFDHEQWPRYPILDVPLERLRAPSRL